MSRRAQNQRVLRFPVISDSPHGAAQALKHSGYTGSCPRCPWHYCRDPLLATDYGIDEGHLQPTIRDLEN